MATEAVRLRIVLDTNVIVAALKSRNPSSPNAELLRRWQEGEFDLLYADALRAEYVETLTARGVKPEQSQPLLEFLSARGIRIHLTDSDVVPMIAADADDDWVLACAVHGVATHLVTYDPHFDTLGGRYHGITILRPLDFLYLLRGDVPPPV